MTTIMRARSGLIGKGLWLVFPLIAGCASLRPTEEKTVLDTLPRNLSSTASVLDTWEASFIDLLEGWQFRPDPADAGVDQGWANAPLEPGAWTLMRAAANWEGQGFPEYDGYAWYRQDVFIPEDWRGSRVELNAKGVDDEYDVFINGVMVRHHGNEPDGSVLVWRTVSPIHEALRFGRKNTIALRVKDWGGEGGLIGEVGIKRILPFDQYRSLLPEPVLDDRPEWVHLYWKAWQVAWRNIEAGTSRNGFVSLYLDDAFNDMIYQWDSVFMTFFARYGRKAFPSIETLDNFYLKQRADGYIARIYRELDGGLAYEPYLEDPNVNPPLFAWAEWEFYRLTGDASRLPRVYPVLVRYYHWLDRHVRSTSKSGLYFQTDFGSGMDNMPRPGVTWRGSWMDMSMEMALFAKMLERIADHLNYRPDQGSWATEYERLRQILNRKTWKAKDAFYYDLTPEGKTTGVRHIGAFWSLLNGVADDKQVVRLVEHLNNPEEFRRRHLFPALAANDKSYDPRGNYWVGGVWAPTNFMVIKGLQARGFREMARIAAENHLENLMRVYFTALEPERINPPERDLDYQSIWECYSADHPAPGTGADAHHYSRHHFVGWSGVGPIALLIENVLGFEVIGAENRVRWDLTRNDRHGIRNMLLTADNPFDLLAEERGPEEKTVRITGNTRKGMRLEVRVEGGEWRKFELPPGPVQLTLN